MSDPKTSRGRCPHCEETTGIVGDACSNRLCQKKGYHLVREDYLQSAHADAERRHGAIDPMLGKRVSKYVLVGRLGEGGMGTVYAALQMPLRREVALKLISTADVDEVSLKRFAREAAATAQLDHPNIVKLFDFGPEDLGGPMPFMVLELVNGRPLRAELDQRLKAGLGWETAELVRLAHQVLSALETAHRAGLVHRDIKPENIMLTPIVGDPNYVKILDFGLARAVEHLQGSEKLSRTGMIMGTPAYMAPEQFLVQPTHEPDYRVDLYAVGVVLFELLVGVKPFPARTWKELASFKLSPAYDPLTELRGVQVAAPIRSFLERALAREPEARFQNALEMNQALVHALRGEPILGLRVQPAPPAAPPLTAAPPAPPAKPAPAPAPVEPKRVVPGATRAVADARATTRLDADMVPVAPEPIVAPRAPEPVAAPAPPAPPRPVRLAPVVATPTPAYDSLSRARPSSRPWVAVMAAVLTLAALLWVGVWLSRGRDASATTPREARTAAASPAPATPKPADRPPEATRLPATPAPFVGAPRTEEPAPAPAAAPAAAPAPSPAAAPAPAAPRVVEPSPRPLPPAPRAAVAPPAAPAPKPARAPQKPSSRVKKELDDLLNL